MSVLDYWENEYQMTVKLPDEEVTDFKITLDVSCDILEKLMKTSDDGDVTIAKYKPLILGWSNLLSDGVPVLCTEENKEQILNMGWILEQVLYTYLIVMKRYCEVLSIEKDARNFMKNLKEMYGI